MKQNPPSVTEGGSFKEHYMLCTVVDIRGDYAYVKYDSTGVISQVALALLPFDIDVGEKLKFENYVFERI